MYVTLLFKVKDHSQQTQEISNENGFQIVAYRGIEVG